MQSSSKPPGRIETTIQILNNAGVPWIGCPVASRVGEIMLNKKAVGVIPKNIEEVSVNGTIVKIIQGVENIFQHNMRTGSYARKEKLEV